MMAGLQLTLLLQFCFVFYVAAKDCSIEIAYSEKEPVYLTSVNGVLYETFKPEGKITTIKDHTKLLLLCYGSKNQLTINGKKEMNLTCNDGAFLGDDKIIYTLKDLQCENVPNAELRITSEKCPDDKGPGFIFKVGFGYNDNQFASVYTICYQTETQTVYYANNIIKGKVIQHARSGTDYARRFRSDGMDMTHAAIDSAYKNSKTTLPKIYGNNELKNTFLARGHLTPRKDGITRYEQFATFYMINVQPEFQSINAGNWLTVEQLVRNAAKNFNTNLDIYNGVIGNLEWQTIAGHMQKVYLDTTNRFPVPKYLFKVILKGDAGIAIVTINDPYIENPQGAVFCKNVCDEANIIKEDFTKVIRGYTFCCKVKEIVDKYKYLPDNVVSVKNLLKF